MESILGKIDPGNLEKSVESIFKMVDYGHQSIADMVPVAMFIDGISVWLAYYIWSLCPTAGGQESSTRYLKMSSDGLLTPDQLGIPAALRRSWQDQMEAAFQAYQGCVTTWEELSTENPSLMGIPRTLQEDPSDPARKKVARMRRNFAFDRARYYLPVAATTNVMLIMSARGWVNLCQYLFSHPLLEPQRLGDLVRRELELAAPRMLKYARVTQAHRDVIAREFDKLVHIAEQEVNQPQPGTDLPGNPATPYLAVQIPPGVTQKEVVDDLASHDNRYAPVGNSLTRISVRFGWTALAFAEIRDLNRHRTGAKYCPQVPQGFYSALDQLPPEALARHRTSLLQAAKLGSSASFRARELLRQRDPTYIYWCLLGTEFPFEHVTTADKFIYEAELRTGLGAHYRYAKHLRDALALWYREFPGTRTLIHEGTAEPE